MPRRLITNPAFFGTWVTVLIWIACVLWAPVDILNYVLRGAVASCAIAVLARYWRAGWVVYREGARHPEDSLILGLVIVAISLIWYMLYSIATRAFSVESWFVYSPWSALYPFMLLMALVLVVTATRFGDEKGSTLRSLAAGGISFAVMTGAVAVHYLGGRVVAAAELVFRLIPH